MIEIEDLLQKCYQANDDNLAHEAAVEIIVFFDECAELENWEKANKILKTIDPEKIATHIILSILNATFPFKTQLPEHPKFLERAEKSLITKLGLERTNKLLQYRR